MNGKEWNDFLDARILAAEAGQATPAFAGSGKKAGLIPLEHALNRVHANHKEVHWKYLKLLKYYSSR
jgi:hypothetical protein